jgi:hypothetical protein
MPTAHLQLSGSNTKARTGGTGLFRSSRGEYTATFVSSTASKVTFSIDR